MKKALVVGVLCSARRHGYTAKALEAALDGARSVRGVQAEIVRLHDFRFGPCTSCFNCIRRPRYACTLDDDFGRKGRGALFRMMRAANGLILADPVHGWGPSAMAHLFYERLYPFLWTGRLNGLPFSSISCASNQGFMREAQRTITRWAFTKSFRLLDGLPLHTSFFQEGLRRSRTLGRRLAREAVRDRRGRRTFSDAGRFTYYAGKPWDPVERYIDNLSHGTGTLRGSLIANALRERTFSRPEALELLNKAKDEFRLTLRHYRAHRHAAVIRHLVRAGTLWTHATWKEFLERDVIRAAQPAVYRPLQDARANRHTSARKADA